jgi:hypothetical protein
MTDDEATGADTIRSIRIPADVDDWLRLQHYERRQSINAIMLACIREAMAAKEAAR